MAVELVAVAAAIDVGPHVGLPGDRHRLALTIAGDAVGVVACVGKQLDRGDATPLVHLPARLPTTEIGMLRAGVELLLLLDHRLEIDIERGAIRHLEVHDRRREERENVEAAGHIAPSLVALSGQRGRGRKSNASTLPRRSSSMPAQAIMAPLSVQNCTGGATRRA